MLVPPPTALPSLRSARQGTRYAYCENNPLGGTDPEGLDPQRGGQQRKNLPGKPTTPPGKRQPTAPSGGDLNLGFVDDLLETAEESLSGQVKVDVKIEWPIDYNIGSEIDVEIHIKVGKGADPGKVTPANPNAGWGDIGRRANEIVKVGRKMRATGNVRISYTPRTGAKPKVIDVKLTLQ